MKTETTVVILCAMLLALGVPARAQQPKKVPRIGWLGAARTSSSRIEAFRQGLHELGYAEGKNIFIEYRYAEGKLDRLPALAAELVRLKVDVIIAGSPQATRSAKQATSTIPIVMAFDDDPVRQGFVTSLARPGGNVTGLATLAPEISGKQLEILKEIVPNLSRVAVLSNISANTLFRGEVESPAAAFGVKLQYLDVANPKDFETAFRAASKGHAQAVLVLPGPVINAQRKQIAELTAKNRLPAIFPSPEYLDVGGLMSYGASVADSYHRAATYVDKILKGARPADLPVEQPTKFELVINLKTAKPLGLTIPPNVLVRADKVIK